MSKIPETPSRRPGEFRRQVGGVYAASTLGLALVVPPVLGLAAGVWLDGRFASGHTWTLILIGMGILSGIREAVRQVRRLMRETDSQ